MKNNITKSQYEHLTSELINLKADLRASKVFSIASQQRMLKLQLQIAMISRKLFYGENK